MKTLAPLKYSLCNTASSIVTDLRKIAKLEYCFTTNNYTY